MSFQAGTIDALSHTTLTSHSTHIPTSAFSSPEKAEQGRGSKEQRNPYKRRQGCRDTPIPCATTGFMPRYRGTGTVPSLPGYLRQVPVLSRQQDELLMNEMAKANMLSLGNRFLPLVCSGLSQHQGQQPFPAASLGRGGRILLCCLFILLLLLSKYLLGRGRIPFTLYLFLQVN